ncbi:hypothetical protein Tco_0876710 [Tanacetum coccineum]|uniref:Uncharacterized protein n=1 Tax=Tanacetum coccineum TaxID=301880 RepID=A0ABQ5BUS3_9ASTR
MRWKGTEDGRAGSFEEGKSDVKGKVKKGGDGREGKQEWGGLEGKGTRGRRGEGWGLSRWEGEERVSGFEVSVVSDEAKGGGREEVAEEEGREEREEMREAERAKGWLRRCNGNGAAEGDRSGRGGEEESERRAVEGEEVSDEEGGQPLGDVASDPFAINAIEEKEINCGDPMGGFLPIRDGRRDATTMSGNEVPVNDVSRVDGTPSNIKVITLVDIIIKHSKLLNFVLHRRLLVSRGLPICALSIPSSLAHCYVEELAVRLLLVPGLILNENFLTRCGLRMLRLSSSRKARSFHRSSSSIPSQFLVVAQACSTLLSEAYLRLIVNESDLLDVVGTSGCPYGVLQALMWYKGLKTKQKRRL